MTTLSNVNRVRAAPRASVLIESLRDVGYTLDSALADVIDNALSARARSVRILAHTSGPSPRIGILDDGMGMDGETLLDAMRLGSRSPLDDREPSDLGRFGLGLKTASFSQCRRLTVVTRQRGATSAACWDLDNVAAEEDWVLDIPNEPSDLPWVDQLGESGTLVLWENLDRLTAGERGDAADQQFVRRLSQAAEHLELVFHRFLSGEPGLKRVTLSLNGRQLEPSDPFPRHDATVIGPVETIRIGRHHVRLQEYTLPHHRKVSASEWERNGGRAGYIKNQGFYVYRGGRLIIHGTWFGLARQTELTKLTRVRVDMPTGLDTEWKVDIKKASAQLPPQVRERLRHLTERIGATSRHVYTARGQTLVSDERLPVWQREQNKGEIRYRVNGDHPLMAAFLARLPDDLRRDFPRILEVIGAAIPLDTLFADISSQPSGIGGSPMSPDTLAHLVSTTYWQLRRSGIDAADITTMLRAAEPFRSNWDAVEALLTEADCGNDAHA